MTTKRAGWMTLQGVGQVQTIELVERIRKFRGRKTFNQIVGALGLPQCRANWLKVWDLCRRYEIATADTDDPEYFRSAIAADRKQQQEIDRARLQQARLAEQQRATGLAKAALKAEIARAVKEQHTAPRYKPGALEWRP